MTPKTHLRGPAPLRISHCLPPTFTEVLMTPKDDIPAPEAALKVKEGSGGHRGHSHYSPQLVGPEYPQPEQVTVAQGSEP